MNWRDLLYFSKGERRALTVLVCLITIGGILAILNERSIPEGAIAEPQYIVHPENAPTPIVVNTKKPQNTQQKKNYSSYPKTEKYPAGTVIELNTADTTTLKKVPGIGSTFAKRIIKYRDLLGGFYSVTQLREVYGIDEERYQHLHQWFHADRAFIAQLPVNDLPSDSLARHPYINYKQAKTIYKLRKQKGRLSGWENLHLLEEFNKTDYERLKNYLSF